DKTKDLFLNNKFLNCNYLKNSENLGQSQSILRGIKESTFDTIITIDADLQNNPSDILKLYNIYVSNSKVKLVGGIRYKRKDTFTKVISSKIANTIRSAVLNDNCPDTGCSLKIFNKKIFLSFPFFDGIHRFLPALFKGYNHDTIFVAVDHRSRKYGVSKYGTIDRLFRGIRDLFKVKGIINNYSNSNSND
ncbi:glycosyltransferase, partial [Pelagibacteraceae bacterium]|nr:glycosyltransferase [Pelagibacteraceae bacterium]